VTDARSTPFRATRIALVVIGLAAALLAGAYLWTFTGGVSSSPMILCLHPDDVACSDDYFLGRDHAEHIAQLVALLIGVAGLTLVAASSLWSKRLRGRPRG
jgi:uncharacterized membrane protein YuzA (DUF378 family)